MSTGENANKYAAQMDSANCNIFYVYLLYFTQHLNVLQTTSVLSINSLFEFSEGV